MMRAIIEEAEESRFFAPPPSEPGRPRARRSRAPPSTSRARSARVPGGVHRERRHAAPDLQGQSRRSDRRLRQRRGAPAAAGALLGRGAEAAPRPPRHRHAGRPGDETTCWNKKLVTRAIDSSWPSARPSASAPQPSTIAVGACDRRLVVRRSGGRQLEGAMSASKPAGGRSPSGRFPAWSRTGVASTHQLVYSKFSPGRSTGCAPTTPSPRTSCTLPLASVMIQCRLSQLRGLLPLVLDAHGVRERELAGGQGRAFGDVLALDRDHDSVGERCG